MELSRNIKGLLESKYRNIVINWFASAFGGTTNATKALTSMVNDENHSDEMIYSLTHTYRKKYTQPEVAETRIAKRLKNRKNDIQKLINGIDYPKHIYLDIGCETMKETEMLGESLDIADVRCINIQDWVGSYEENVMKSDNDTRFSYYDGVNIPYGDKTISAITMNMVIHHVPDTTKIELLQNVHRVLEPNGIFCIREHDSFDDPETKKYFDKYLDFTHHFFDSVINTKYKWVDDYHTTYTSADQLKEMLEKIGFKSIKRITFEKPDRSYYEIFRVIKTIS